MKPQKLTICGWGPYKDKVEVDFDKFQGRGLFLITGPTGAGKTTLFDAISYALYGALSGEMRDKERSSVRSDFAESDTPTYVELWMEHGGKTYHIRRNPEYLRPKKRTGKENAFTKEKENAILSLPEGKVIEGVKEVNAYMKELLKLDYTQFKQLSMIAQGEFARLLTAPPKDKTRIFREIFSTGMYERFTANLSARAKKQYALIAEQKHKLEEDIRLLLAGLGEMGLEESLQERFRGAVEARYWNHEEIQACLSEMIEQAKENRAEQEKQYRKAEKKLEEIQILLTRKQEENKRIQEYQHALATEEALKGKEGIFAKKAGQYQAAVNAGWVELSDVKHQQAAAGCEELKKQHKQLEAELSERKREIEALQDFWEHRELLQDLIACLDEAEKKAEEIRSLEKALQKKNAELSQERENYVQKEQVSLAQKAAYEDALLARKRAAIGLAASMLEAGKPCPVCGALEHPCPAKLSGEVLSEQELEALKRKLEEKEAMTRACYQRVLVLQTQAGQCQESLAKQKQEEAWLRQKIEQVTEPICVTFMQLGAVEAGSLWQKNKDTYAGLQAIVQEKEGNLQQIMSRLQQQKGICKDARQAFEQALSQYGFAHESAYRQAYLDKAGREALAGELEQYQQQRTANQKLLEHLKQTISGEALVDLEPLEAERERLKKDKDGLLAVTKRHEQSLAELKKTRRLCKEKLERIEEQSREYGCIKELENIATGNNAKKLVFEQYVLAGYFEEILLAANVRFRKMTSGRYEMHRTKEVGDGRVKDNLEIEVMDFYTGKYRSVRTLSGGESFKASLSLALGLSDVIQAMSGGVRVDALFIDEGFGALDSESLDQACNTLMSLVETQRLIGIISHVQELRERIDKQIVIEKSGSGSTLKIVEGI